MVSELSQHSTASPVSSPTLTLQDWYCIRNIHSPLPVEFTLHSGKEGDRYCTSGSG